MEAQLEKTMAINGLSEYVFEVDCSAKNGKQVFLFEAVMQLRKQRIERV